MEKYDINKTMNERVSELLWINEIFLETEDLFFSSANMKCHLFSTLFVRIVVVIAVFLTAENCGREFFNMRL